MGLLLFQRIVEGLRERRFYLKKNELPWVVKDGEQMVYRVSIMKGWLYWLTG